MSTLDFMERVCRSAGEILRERFGQAIDHSDKGQGELVSQADLEVEGFILSEIQRAFPEDRIFSEESGASGSAGSRLWIVDPLDGTANFLFGVPHFAVSVACEEDGRLVSSVVFNPVSGDLFSSDGEQALLNGRPIQCSDRSSLKDSLVAVGLSVTPKNWSRYLDEWGRLFSAQKKGLALLCPSLNICNVACGRIDAFIDFGSEMEGHAAASLIAQRAGAVVKNYDFTPWDHRTKGIIVSAPGIEEELRKVRTWP